MSTANNGGPAFPRPVRYQKHEYGRRQESVGWVAEGGEGGITMRDYFAAKAMQALIPLHEAALQSDGEIEQWSTDYEGNLGSSAVILAFDAYGIADAMLKAREAVKQED